MSVEPMSVEQIILESLRRGAIEPQMAKWLLLTYKNELGRHGVEKDARSFLIELIKAAPQAHRQRLTQVLANLNQAEGNPLCDDTPPSIAMRLMTAVLGAIAGAIFAVSAIFILYYCMKFVVEAVFGSSPTRVRVPIKGFFAVVIAPLAGAVVGSIIGWTFDRRKAANKFRELIDATSVYDRAAIAWAIIWSVGVLIAFVFFDPLQRYGWWRSRDFGIMSVLLLGPMLGGWLLLRLLLWVGQGRRK